MPLVTLACCNLDQWALDFEGNLERIIQSIKIAKEKGARYRLGSELEVTGYGCEDHFLESDTFLHAWEVMAAILKSKITNDILCDIGMPVMHRNVRYNCRVLVLNGRIVFIKPKMFLAADGNYRENRWFQAWEHVRELEAYYLPRMIREITGQETVPFGDGCLALRDTVLSAETCEELWTPAAPHIYHGLNGVEIFGNGSSSHHQLRKLNTRISFMVSATEKSGGIYLYSNQRGCDGGRLYFDGSAMIIMNGKLYAQAPQFSFKDVEVIAATLDVEDVRSYRGAITSRGAQASKSAAVPRVNVDFDLTSSDHRKPSAPIEVRYPLPEEEIAYGPSGWLWDYLRRSRTGGFFLPLSGGADSSAVATMVHIMCCRVVDEIKAGNATVLRDLQAITGEPNFVPTNSKEIAGKIFYTSYMGSSNSSEETKHRARVLSELIGAQFLPVKIDAITKAFTDTVTASIGKAPRFKIHGGTENENLALQNIQARSRMVLGYYLAQLLPWSRSRSGSLLVLSSANVDESLRGYMTKYDCSSGDLNPIGSISKTDLKLFLGWAAKVYNLPILREVLTAPPTAELEPITATYTQTDEADMGMSYDELSVFGRLRKIHRCGPLAMFDKLCNEWNHLPPKTVADKVKRFFFYYSINRHKMTTLTPSYHAESYSPDDNRYDLRQFLYNSKWTWQFRAIDAHVARLSKGLPPPAAAAAKL